MKYTVFFCLLLLCINSNSQSIEKNVINSDKDTKETSPNINMSFKELSNLFNSNNSNTSSSSNNHGQIPNQTTTHTIISSSSSTSSNVEGSIFINNQKYRAVCECNDNKQKSRNNQEKKDPSNDKKKDNKESASPACDPSKIKITTEMTGTGSTIDKIRELIGGFDVLQYAEVTDYSFFCLDGRNKKNGAATPGADAGEFILALDVYENLLPGNRKLDQKAIELFFKSYLKYMSQPTFRMCTDDKALEYIKNEMQVNFIIKIYLG